MFYSFLKVLVGFTLKLFFRKIFISGTELIKKDTPQLIASNHPNGFLEPLVMACFFPKALHFLVRGDVFDNPILKPLLKSTNQIPIFRFRDGFSRLRENSQTIDESLQVLIDKHNLLIFAEGNTESIKKLRPLQKGIARIAFQTLEKQPDLDLEILPVGINFTIPDKFDQTVMLRVGKPLKVQNYIDNYHKDKNTGTQLLLDGLYTEMKKNVVHLEDQHRKTIFEKLAVINRFKDQKSYLPVFLRTDLNLEKEINLARNVDDLLPQQLESLHITINAMEKKMATFNLNFHKIFLKPLTIKTTILLLVGFLPAVFGAFVHSLPIGLGYWFTKSKVKQKEFKASILMVSVLLLMMIHYFILLILNIVLGWPFYLLLICFASGFVLRFYYVLLCEITLKPKKLILRFRNDAFEILDSVTK